MTKKIVNNVLVDLTAEEETELQNERDKLVSEKTAEDNATAQKVDLKASAKAKLIAGEALTEDEANELVGL